MEFSTVILRHLQELKTEELVEIKAVVDKILGGEDLEHQAKHKRDTEGMLQAVKYVKDRTRWDLKTCKHYVDHLR